MIVTELSPKLKGMTQGQTMNDEAKTMLENAAERTGKDFSELEELFESELEDFKANLSRDMPEASLERSAAMSVKNRLTNMSGSSYSGDMEELPILTIGYEFRDSEYFFTDDDAIIGLGIVRPDESNQTGLATFIIDSSHGVDLDHVRECFEPLNTLRGHVTRRTIGDWDGEPKFRKNGMPTHICNTTSKSKFEIVDPDSVGDDDPISELPAGTEDRRDMINEHFISEKGGDHATLANIREHLSVMNDKDFPLGFGIDVKRIRGQVVNVFSKNGFASMTVLDESIDVEDDVDDDLINEHMRTPGLQVVMEDELLKYGEKSFVDVYGYISQNPKTGQIRMNGFGIIPLVEFERGSGGSSVDDNAEEETL